MCLPSASLFPRWYHGQAWPRLKPGARNSVWVSHILGMVPVLGPSSDAFPSALAKGWIGTRAAGTPLAPIWDAAVPSVA